MQRARRPRGTVGVQRPAQGAAPAVGGGARVQRRRRLPYAFNFDELDAEDLAPISKKFKVDVPSLISHPREIWGIQTPPAVPATFYINPNGEIVKSLFRPQTKDSLNEILYSLQKGA